MICFKLWWNGYLEEKKGLGRRRVNFEVYRYIFICLDLFLELNRWFWSMREVIQWYIYKYQEFINRQVLVEEIVVDEILQGKYVRRRLKVKF